MTRLFVVLLLTFYALPALAAPRVSAKKAKPAVVLAAKAKPASQPSFWVVSCTSACAAPKSAKLSWSDGWTAVDGEKLRRDLERTCVADLKVARCARPSCACTAKLAAPASQPASRPAATKPVKLTQEKKTATRGDDLPPPGEARVEVTP